MKTTWTLQRALAAAGVSVVVACASSTSPSPAPVVATAASAPSSPAPSASAPPVPTLLMPGVGMSSKKPTPESDDDEPTGPPVACAKDEDCWSRTCCPAKAPEECVHASRARKCAIVDIKCSATPIHYTCVCDSGTCRGRLAPP